jgi:biotin transport system substrate-specific component
MTTPLAQRLLPADGAGQRALRAVVLVLIGSALMTVCAKIQVPFWPVPQSMQSFAALLIGATFGGALATATIGAYLLQGLAGLPVFAYGGAGAAYFVGPTAGFLIGFLAAGALIGYAADRGLTQRISGLVASLLAGAAVIFLLGWAWLSVLIGVEAAFYAGVVPFLLGDALKIALVAAIVLSMRRRS